VVDILVESCKSRETIFNDVLILSKLPYNIYKIRVAIFAPPFWRKKIKCSECYSYSTSSKYL